MLFSVVSCAHAFGGYDVAHIVKRTCKPGGPLIVTDDYKGPRDDDRRVTEPGRVIGCPPAGPRQSFQIAAGPQRIGRDWCACTYFSLFNGDGADVCSPIRGDAPETRVDPLMAVDADDSDRIAVGGTVSADVETVVVDEGASSRVVGIGPKRGYFSVAVEGSTLCSGDPLTLRGRDGSGHEVAAARVQLSMSALATDDHATYARSLNTWCRSGGTDQAVELRGLGAIATALQSLL